MRILRAVLKITALMLLCPAFAHAQPSATPTDPGQQRTLEQQLAEVKAMQQQLEEQQKKSEARIRELEAEISASAAQPVPAATAQKPATAEAAAQDDATAKAAAAMANMDQTSAMAPGKGGLNLYKSGVGSVNLMAYADFRVIDQEPGTQYAQTYYGAPLTVDALGNPTSIDTRRDIQFHRVLISLAGFLYDPRFTYQLTWWTVNDTEQVRIVGGMFYKFSDAFTLAGGVSGLPGTRSLLGSHPFWLGNDRVMADEYFRTGFVSGIWGTGMLTPTLGYKLMVGTNISLLGVSATKDTRDLAYGGSLWWMPTTGEFGPQGAYGDFEMHDSVATRIGVSLIDSPKEDRTAQPSASSPDSTQIHLGDSALLFGTNALAPGATVQNASYQSIATDWAFKYRGIFVQAEAYMRYLSHFTPTITSAPLPFTSIRDTGFYVQAAFYPLPRTLELYTATSQIFPDSSRGYRHSYEYLMGANWYWSHTRNQRVNFQVIDVTRSPASSTFGYYTGGMTGQTYSMDVSYLF